MHPSDFQALFYLKQQNTHEIFRQKASIQLLLSQYPVFYIQLQQGMSLFKGVCVATFR